MKGCSQLCRDLRLSFFLVEVATEEHLSIYAASWENLSLGFMTRSDINWPVQPKKISRGMKFLI